MVPVKRKVALVPYVFAIIICFCVSYPIFTKGVILDEAYSINLVRGSIRDIIGGTASDVHPPLYYLLLKMTAFLGGESLIGYGIVTALAAWLNVLLLGATVIRKRWGNWASVIYIMWFGMTYATIEYSVLIRMYSWSAFFVTASALLLYFYYEQEKNIYLVVGILMTLAAMYTHYYALMAVFFEWCILFLITMFRKRYKIMWVIAGGILILAGYFPWLRVLASQSGRVSNGYWIKKFDLGQWLLSPANLMMSELEGAEIALYFCIFVVLFMACLKRQKEALLSFLVFALTMITGQAISVLVTPIWQDRYLYVVWGMLALFVALATGQKESGYSALPKASLVIFLCISLMCSMQKAMRDELLACSDKEWVEFLRNHVEKDALVIVDDPYEHIVVFQYYLPDAELVMVESLMVDGSEENQIEKILQKAELNQAWYVIDYIQPRLGIVEMEELLEKNHYKMKFMGEYTITYKQLGIYNIERILNEEVKE